MRIIVFGTGNVYMASREKLQGMDIAAFLDNDPHKQGTYLEGRLIDAPENIGRYAYDCIVLASVHYQEMRAQLEGMGIDKDLIIDRENRGYWSKIRRVESYGWAENSLADRKILLITHDLSLTGAPLMLYYGACILKEKGYGVSVYSKADGRLRYDYLHRGISVSIFEEYDFREEEIRQYFGQYDLILVNTVVLWGLVEKLEKMSVPVLWWLHEEDNAYDEYKVGRLPSYENLHVYGVGNRAVTSYRKHGGKQEIGRLVYGIPDGGDTQRPPERDCGGKIIYAVIGYLSKRKGQDIFISAIEKNWERWKDQAKFWVIGAAAPDQEKAMKATGKAEVYGSVSHERMLELYKEIDVVVCPSRNDPMPVVLTEGMMHRKVCIASDMTGTAELITSFENGLVCRADDIESLSQQIEWTINHRDRFEAIGECAYRTYQENFSLEQFSRHLLGIVGEMMNPGNTLK